MAPRIPPAVRTFLHDPFAVARLILYGLVGLLALHATVLPQHKETDFVLFLFSLGAFVVFSAAYIGWLWFHRTTRSAGPGPASGPGIPPEGAPIPVPVGPRTPVLVKGEAKDRPRTPDRADAVGQDPNRWLRVLPGEPAGSP